MGIKSIIGVVLGLTLVQTTHASTTTYSWSGSILNVKTDNGSNIYSGAQVGDNYSGSFTFNSNVGSITGLDTSDGDSVIELSDTWVEYFLGSGSGTVTNGTTQVNANNATLSITNDNTIDEPDQEIVVSDLLGKSVAFGTPTDEWGLDSSTGNFVFSVGYLSLDTDIYNDLSFQSTPPWSPANVPNDPDNQVAFFSLSEYEFSTGDEIFSAYGVITTSTVPIPAAVWLFGSGLIGLIGVARRKTHA